VGTARHAHLAECFDPFIESLYEVFFAFASTFNSYTNLRDVNILHLPNPTV